DRDGDQDAVHRPRLASALRPARRRRAQPLAVEARQERARTSWNSMVVADSTFVNPICGGWTPKSVMSILMLPATWALSPETCTVTVAVASRVTPWTVSCPGTLTVTCWPDASPAGKAADVAWKEADAKREAWSAPLKIRSQLATL